MKSSLSAKGIFSEFGDAMVLGPGHNRTGRVMGFRGAIWRERPPLAARNMNQIFSVGPVTDHVTCSVLVL